MGQSVHDSDSFEWHDTKLVKRKLTATAVFMIAMGIGIVILILTGFLRSLLCMIAPIVVCFGAGSVGGYVGIRLVLARDPTHVGLSDNGIRLRYHDGSHRDIPWRDIDTILMQDSRAPPRIIHKDGSRTLLVIPVRIVNEVKNRHQVYVSTKIG